MHGKSGNYPPLQGDMYTKAEPASRGGGQVYPGRTRLHLPPGCTGTVPMGRCRRAARPEPAADQLATRQQALPAGGTGQRCQDRAPGSHPRWCVLTSAPRSIRRACADRPSVAAGSQPWGCLPSLAEGLHKRMATAPAEVTAAPNAVRDGGPEAGLCSKRERGAGQAQVKNGEVYGNRRVRGLRRRSCGFVRGEAAL